MNLTRTPAVSSAYPSQDREQPSRTCDPSTEEPLLGREIVARITRIVENVVHAARLSEEREDCIQEALLRFWQRAREQTAKKALWHLGGCGFFVRDRLKRGRCVDSPKRRYLRIPVPLDDDGNSIEELPQLVSNRDPSRYAAVNDDLKCLNRRLTQRSQAILQLFLEGHDQRDVARQLKISPALVCRSSGEIRAAALEMGLFPAHSRGCEQKDH